MKQISSKFYLKHEEVYFKLILPKAIKFCKESATPSTKTSDDTFDCNIR